MLVLRVAVKKPNTWLLNPSLALPLQVRIHTGFHRFTEIGQSFHNIFLIRKRLFKLQGFIQGKRNWPISCLNDSETQEKGLKGVKLKSKKVSRESIPPDFPESFRLRRSFSLGNRSVFFLDPRLP